MSKRITIELVREFAQNVGYNVQEDKYINKRTHMHFKCNKCGEVLTTYFDNFKIHHNCKNYCNIDITKLLENKGKYEERCKELNLHIVDNEHNNFSVLSNKIILSDKEGYLYSLDFNNLKVIKRRNTTPAIFFNLNPYTKENIRNYIRLNDINIELIDEDFNGVDAKTQMIWNCPIHGKFEKSWNEIKNGQYCPICGKLHAIEGRKNDYEMIKKGFEDVGYTLISKEYISNQEPLEYICSHHKDVGIQTISWASLISGHRCIHCVKERMFNAKDINPKSPKSHMKFAKQIHEMYGDKFTFLGEYYDSKTKIEMYCNDCKSTFLGSPNHMLEGHLGCSCKSKSLGEDFIKEWLDVNHVGYLREHRIKDCKDKKPLPFDFIIYKDIERTKFDFLIEFQGKQHYENTNWTTDPIESLRIFKIQQKHDKIKFDYCNDNNIKLLRIPYWEMNNLNKILELNCTR